MAAAVRTAALAALLAGPVVLAFFSGGYFDEPREWAGMLAWVLVIVAALVTRAPLPRTGPGRLAVLGLAALTAWTALSMLWAPIAGAAQDDTQRLLVYLGFFVAAVALLRGSGAIRAVEPALAAGALIVIGYGLAGRLVPDVVPIAASDTAFGRLDQPLTYWNAMGALAAIGIVLCARIAGDETRAVWMRAAAAATAAPLGMAVYLSFSRAAILAVAVGAIVTVALVPERRQVRAVIVTLAAGLLAAIPAALLPAVRALEGSGSTKTWQGAVALVALAAIALAAALLTRRLARGEHEAAPLRLPRPRWILALLVGLLAVGTVAAAAAERRSGNPTTGASTQRLASVESNRYAYWRVAFDDFTTAPLQGPGSGAFRVAWRRERTIDDPAKDAHSLYLETLTELGLIGLAALAAFLAGLGLAAARAYRAGAVRVAGPAAALATWAVHAGLDWDWEMPALTLFALVLAAALVALNEDVATR
jgi:O-Antigen ligase